MLALEVHVMSFWVRGRVSALLTHLDFVSPLLVRVIVSDPVDLQGVRLQRTPLSERLVTVIAFVGPDSCVSSRVTLQVKGVIESLAAEGAQVSLYVRVTFKVSVQEARERELLAAHVTLERVFVTTGRRLTGSSGR